MAPLQRSPHPRRTPPAQLPILARSFLMLAIIGAVALAGCSTVLVSPDIEASANLPAHRHVAAHQARRLLASQAPPNCEYKGPDGDGLDADLFARLKLDYERHCYQHAEALVRSRLHQLQVSGLCEPRRVAHRQRFLRAAPTL